MGGPWVTGRLKCGPTGWALSVPSLRPPHISRRRNMLGWRAGWLGGAGANGGEQGRRMGDGEPGRVLEEQTTVLLVTQLCLTLRNPMDCSPPGASVHGILQARTLERVAISFSRGSFWPRDRTQVSCIAGGFFTVWATREALEEQTSESKNRSAMSDSLRPHGPYSPWNSPGQNTGEGSRSLLQVIFPTQGSNPGLLQADSLPSEPPERPKNTGVGSLSLLQGILPTQESNRGLLHCRQILYQLNELSPQWIADPLHTSLR